MPSPPCLITSITTRSVSSTTRDQPPQPPQPPLMRKVLLSAAQIALAALVVWYYSDRLAPMWVDFTQTKVSLALKPAWIGAATLTVLATYGILIEAWRRVLVGWAQK